MDYPELKHIGPPLSRDRSVEACNICGSSPHLCHLLMIIMQEAAQSLAVLHRPFATNFCIARKQQ